jgi:ATP-dependent helicase/nuclease subunit B
MPSGAGVTGCIIPAMAGTADYPRLAHDEVLERLTTGTVGDVSVVTPNRRLAAALQRDFGETCVVRGLHVWETPDILSFAGFIQRAADLLRVGAAVELPAMLAPEQSRALWEACARDAGTQLLSAAETAVLAHEAWQSLVAWRLRPALRGTFLNDDARTFLDWAARVERELRRRGQMDTVELADALLSHIIGRRISLPPQVVAYGFDSFTPQQAEFLAALHESGSRVMLAGPAAVAGSVTRLPCDSAESELRAAADWARERLEAGCRRIAVVVPDIAARRSAIVRIFSTTMAPDYALPDAASGVLPFNLSLGEPLTRYPLVNAAVTVLQLAGRQIEYERVSHLLRSPFIAGGESERSARSAFDMVLRRRADPLINLDGLCAALAAGGDGCARLRRQLDALSGFRKDRLFVRQAPSAWARAMSEALALTGFPGERALDSAEYQTLKRWHDTLAAFAALDCVVPRMAYAEALSRLRRLAEDTLFQPESPEVPIQILGVLETSGQTFDALWVAGLDDEHWPPPYRPNPFLPLPLQRAAGLPQSSAEQSLENARLLTQRWCAAAAEVVLSHVLHEDDRELQPSPLIADIPARPAQAPGVDYRLVIHAAVAMDVIAERALPLGAAMVTGGGTGLLKDQAACPFRAFANHRLHTEAPETPHTGLDALERGTLVHRVLAVLWNRLQSSAVLAATDEVQLDALLQEAAEAAIAGIQRYRPFMPSGRFTAIEKTRLIALAKAWLANDRQRSAFSVVAVEEKRAFTIGPLSLNARLDRVDQTDDGRRIVLDYKTGAANAAAMLGERPDEPQLPLYLVATEPDAVALAFAQVRAGKHGYAGLARDADLLPGIKAYAESRHSEHGDWPGQVAAWREALEKLATEFADGNAVVDPKGPQTCQYCDLGPLCRIRERSGVNLQDGEADE